MQTLLAVIWTAVRAYPNRMFPTPPLGWSGYQALMQGSGHCSDAGASGYNEQTFRDSMHILEATKLLDLGYRLILADDCWIADNRSSTTGEIVADPTRFPNGMSKLADLAHSKGMLLGLYAAAGKETCRKYPGSLGHEELDADTYATYGADFVKLDACGRSPLGPRRGPAPDWSVQFETWSNALRNQSKTMSFSCEWPAYYDLCTMKYNSTHSSPPNNTCGHDPWSGSPNHTKIAGLCQVVKVNKCICIQTFSGILLNLR